MRWYRGRLGSRLYATISTRPPPPHHQVSPACHLSCACHVVGARYMVTLFHHLFSRCTAYPGLRQMLWNDTTAWRARQRFSALHGMNAATNTRITGALFALPYLAIDLDSPSNSDLRAARRWLLAAARRPSDGKNGVCHLPIVATDGILNRC